VGGYGYSKTVKPKEKANIMQKGGVPMTRTGVAARGSGPTTKHEVTRGKQINASAVK